MDQKELATTEPMEARLPKMKKERELMDKFITEQLKEGTDWDISFKAAKKPSLLKPGSEKVCLLLNLMPTFEVDHETLANMPDAIRSDNIVYRCKLVHRETGQIVADGRGSCSIKEKQSNVNTAIKIAEKRAQVDATLRVAALSDRFTQDMEPGEQPPGEEKPATEKQRTFIARLLHQKGMVPADIQRTYGIPEGQVATMDQATQIIDDLLKLPDVYKPTPAFQPQP